MRLNLLIFRISIMDAYYEVRFDQLVGRSILRRGRLHFVGSNIAENGRVDPSCEAGRADIWIGANP
jgi:hypothetical protein